MEEAVICQFPTFTDCVSALHFKESGRRHQAVTKKGAPQWQQSFLNGKNGEHDVAKPHKTLTSYAVLSILLIMPCLGHTPRKTKYFIQIFSISR